MLITLNEIIIRGKGDTSLQLLINRFAPLYDPNIEGYLQIQLLRRLSGAIGGASIK